MPWKRRVTPAPAGRATLTSFCLANNAFWALENNIRSESKQSFPFVRTGRHKRHLRQQSPGSVPVWLEEQWLPPRSWPPSPASLSSGANASPRPRPSPGTPFWDALYWLHDVHSQPPLSVDFSPDVSASPSGLPARRDAWPALSLSQVCVLAVERSAPSCSARSLSARGEASSWPCRLCWPLERGWKGHLARSQPGTVV